MSSILSPISLMATSQLMRVHLPATSFIGYLSRRSPCACSRAAAPLAQWAPRLRGESKPGSWPIHTPFCTSAMIVQPTEQCVHTDFLMSILPPVGGPAASASRTLPPATADTAARPPMASPEFLKKARRSNVPGARSCRADDNRGPFATPLIFFLSMPLSLDLVAPAEICLAAGQKYTPQRASS